MQKSIEDLLQGFVIRSLIDQLIECIFNVSERICLDLEAGCQTDLERTAGQKRIDELNNSRGREKE